MELFRKLDQLPQPLQNGALAIGNFDGVHHGHAKLVARLRKLADEIGGPAIVFTFAPHPVRILRPDQAPPPLTWTWRKAELLSRLGVDSMIAFPTDEQLLELSYSEFFHQIVRKTIGAQAMVEGPNFHFGKNRQGNVDKLKQLCRENGMPLEIVEPTMAGSELISSSRIRNLIRAGDVDKARSYLTEPYRIRGMVTHGAARGRKIGFPTANLDAVDTLIPGSGVYAGRAYVDQIQTWAAIHVGPNPTFQETHTKVEVHLLDFDETVYGQVLEVDFVSRLRDICRFDSPQKLIQQVHADVESTREISKTFDHNN